MLFTVKAKIYVYECPSFDKSTLKHYLNYCYGIESSIDDLSLESNIELVRFLVKGTIRIIFLSLSNKKEILIPLNRQKDK